MSRQSKILAAALLSLLAVAVPAASAQAGIFKANANPAKITGVQVGLQELKTILGTIDCELDFQGELAGSSEELTATPKFTGCEYFNTPVDFAANGCDFRFHAGATLEAGAVEGSMDIICPAGAAMDFGITFNPTCHLRIGEQLGLGVTYTNHPVAKDVDFDFSISEELKYTFALECPVMAGEYEGGSYTGTSTVKAGSGGAAVGFAVE